MGVTKRPPTEKRSQAHKRAVQAEALIKQKAEEKASKKTLIFRVDCTVPAKDTVLDPSDFEKYLKEHIKVDKKLGNLGDAVVVTRINTKVEVRAKTEKLGKAFSKRYLKYLTKKYIKKQQLKEYVKVIASGKDEYKITYFKLAKEAAEA